MSGNNPGKNIYIKTKNNETKSKDVCCLKSKLAAC
jgi:hypothetical protein